jgi:hypothetical protein
MISLNEHLVTFVVPTKPTLEQLAELTLAKVRELSENATLRPAPNKLRCLPLQTFSLQPIPLWKRQRVALLELSAALARHSTIQ